jgi:hypothetical protein
MPIFVTVFLFKFQILANNLNYTTIQVPPPPQASSSRLPVPSPKSVIVISDSEDENDSNPGLLPGGKGKWRASSKVSSEKVVIDLTADEFNL